MLLSGLAMTVALGCVGRGANEPTPTMGSVATLTVSGTRGSGLDEGIWLYGVPIAGSGHAYHAIPSPTALVAEPAPVATAVVQLQQRDVPVPTPDRRAGVAAASTGGWRNLVEQYGDWNVNTMMRIMACESSGNPLAVSPDGRNWGGLQINVVNYRGDPHDLLDPATNVRVGHDVWVSQGYGAWSCF